MKLPLLITAFFLLQMPLAYASADTRASGIHSANLAEKSGALCQRIERCVWQKLDADTLGKNLQTSLKSDLGALCDSIRITDEADMSPALRQQANTCLDRMLEQECGALVSPQSVPQACSALAKD